MKKNINFFTLILILMPILNIYEFKIHGIGFGDVLVGILLIIIIIKHPIRKIKSMYLPYIIFTIYSILISIITLLIHVEFNVKDVIIRNIIFVFYTAIICLPDEKDFDINKAIIYYKNIASVCSIFVLVQLFCFYILHKTLLGIIPNISLNYSINNYNEYYKSYINLYSYFYRPTSFFLEPAHLAQFLGPALIIVLFQKNKNMILAILYTIAMLLSTSTNAVVIVIMIWLFYLFYIMIVQHTYKKFFYIVGVCLLIVSLVGIVSRTSSTFSYAIERFEKIFSTKKSYGSAYERVFKGYEIWKQLKFPEKIFGIGFGTYNSYYLLGTIDVFNGSVEYMNSFSTILVNGGMLGFSLFIFSIYSYVKNKKFLNYMLTIYIFIIFLSSSVFNTPIYAIVLLMIGRTIKDE